MWDRRRRYTLNYLDEIVASYVGVLVLEQETTGNLQIWRR
jgi:hypothetical protein